MVLEHLNTSGVQEAHRGDRISSTAFTPWPGDPICAEGHYLEGDTDTGTERRACIFIDPEFRTVPRPKSRNTLDKTIRVRKDRSHHEPLIVAWFTVSQSGSFGRRPCLQSTGSQHTPSMSRCGCDTFQPDARAIRDALRMTIDRGRSPLASSLMIEELGICRGLVRVDLAVVSDLFHGYEIKSGRDSFRRLSRQVEHYSKVFDRATLVLGHRRLTEAISCLPTWWGITQYGVEERRIVFRSIRDSTQNPNRVARALVEFLWRDEVLALLKQRNLHIGVRSRPRCELWDRVCSYFDLEEIADAVKIQLMARTSASVLP